MPNISILPYAPTHDAGIRDLCRIPVSGHISLALEREPNYYAGASIQCATPEVYVCLRAADGLVCGVFNIGYRRLFYQGQAVQVRYLCDLRIHPQHQRTSLFYRIVRFAHALGLCTQGLPAQTVVFADNETMVDMINSRAKRRSTGIPYYHYCGRLVTNMLTLRRPLPYPAALSVRRAVPADGSLMRAFWQAEGAQINYCPYYDFERLGEAYYWGLSASDFFLAYEDGELVGICGTWDQRPLKQTRILGYSAAYRTLRPWYNAYARWAGKPTLPKAGAVANYLGLHSILVRGRAPHIFAALLSAVTAAVRDSGAEYLLFALAERDPLQALVNTLPNKRQMYGNYYLVNDGAPLPDDLQNDWFYIEAARI